MKPELAFEAPKCYEIRVRGHLNRHWTGWMDGLDFSYERHGITVLTGSVTDQPQLHGLLLKIRDLGLSLVSVTELIEGQDRKLTAPRESGCYGQEITIGRQIEVHSKILKEERPILISLPDDYHETTEHFPVFYHLDGERLPFQLAAGTIRYLSEWQETIPKIILVAIPNTDRDRDMFPTRATLPTGETIGGGTDDFLRFVKDELVPYIDENFRTLPSRILYGTSNSGLTAIYALLFQSSVFNAIIVSSPTLSWDENYIVRRAEVTFKVWQSAQKFLYIICGREDLGNIRQENVDFAAFLADQSPESLIWGFDISDEARHCPYRSLHDGLTKLFAEWGYPDRTK